MGTTRHPQVDRSCERAKRELDSGEKMMVRRQHPIHILKSSVHSKSFAAFMSACSIFVPRFRKTFRHMSLSECDRPVSFDRESAP